MEVHQIKLAFPYDWKWKTSLLLGAILSATDPVAVVALLKDLGASKKLSTIVEGESMMNDGAAIVVYQLFYRMVLGKSSGWFSVLEYLAEGSLGSYILAVKLHIVVLNAACDILQAQEEAEASGILTLVALGIGVIIAQSIFSIGNLQGASGDPKYLSSETGSMFVFLTGGSVLMTLIINGSTSQLLLCLFGMDALSESEDNLFQETMVNYAKNQLLRKAEEFSRICSGSNNPFDWMTIGGYATFIKDVCEDTIWPPCTTNHCYLEIDDMKTMRVCFLKDIASLIYLIDRLLISYIDHELGSLLSTRAAYWSTFNEGRITESTISVLMESIEEAIDLANWGLHDWNYISTRLKFAGYYKFFSTRVCPPWLPRWLHLKKLQDSCHTCSAFIHSHRIARQLLLDYTGDNGNAAIVVAESEVEELEAMKFLENVKNSMPEACERFCGKLCIVALVQMLIDLLIVKSSQQNFLKFTQVTFSMLKSLDECLSDMEKDGILTEKVVLHVHDLLQVNVLHASISCSIALFLWIPKPGDVLSIHPSLGNLSPAIQSDLERSANSMLKTPDCTVYTKGSKLTSVWLIGNGSVRSKRSPIPVHYPVDSTYPRGSILGLYEALVVKPYLCDMVTDSVALCNEIKLESIISVLSRENGVEELLWKECIFVVSKLLAPDIFKKFSMQEVDVSLMKDQS
ncbi:Sodium/hydrogen exchanger 7 [Capsicum chinense]|nr:Sodium/hydrogen exchanger 7 [Capsicum chinense]